MLICLYSCCGYVFFVWCDLEAFPLGATHTSLLWHDVVVYKPRPLSLNEREGGEGGREREGEREEGREREIVGGRG